MAISEFMGSNLLTTIQKFITPELVEKCATMLGVPPEKVKSGFNSVVPTFLMGVLDRGSSPEGARNLMSLIEKEHYDSAAVPASLLGKGTELVSSILGPRVGSVVEKIGASNGLSSGIVHKLLELAAPLVMGVVGSTIKKLGISPGALPAFFGQQKDLISPLVPAGLFEKREEIPPTVPPPVVAYEQQKKKRSWVPIGVGTLAVLAALWATLGRKAPPPVDREQAGIVALQERQGVEAFTAFLDSGSDQDLPKRILLENLHFYSGVSQPVPESGAVIDRIANALKTHPTAKVRLESFTDNRGSTEVNKRLSNDRATAVKNELINRGVESDRIEAVGLGALNPVASNDTEEGRAQNRRTEIVVVQR